MDSNQTSEQPSPRIVTSQYREEIQRQQAERFDSLKRNGASSKILPPLSLEVDPVNCRSNFIVYNILIL